MNLKIYDEDIVIFINKELIDFDYKIKEKMEEYMKNLIIKIKKIYKYKISGSYDVDIYQNNNYGLIIEINKKDDLEFFPDLIDLKINIFYDSDIYLKIEDYFLIKDYKSIYHYKNNYYLNIKDINYKDKLFLSEFCKYSYGKNLKKIKNKLVLMK